MEGREELEARLATLRDELSRAEGRQTEVYSRIVGYYRSVRNWNAGKREEYSDRVVYGLPHRAAPGPASAPVAAASAVAQPRQVLQPAARAAQSGLLVFTRKACPNCPPVADFIRRRGLSAIFVDVDGVDGLALARRHSILATPTVLGLDGEGRESFRAYGLEEVMSLLPEPALGPC